MTSMIHAYIKGVQGMHILVISTTSYAGMHVSIVQISKYTLQVYMIILLISKSTWSAQEADL